MIPERRQTALLARVFFGRLFESDLMTPGSPQTHLVVWVVAFLVGASAALPVLLTKKYIWLAGDAIRLNAALAADRTIALLLSTIATALITLVIWENVFPDRRDGRVLGVLPIRRRTFVVARMAALLALFVLLVGGMTVVQGIAFGLLSISYGGAGEFLRVAAAHMSAAAGLEGTVFFGIIALQCALLNLFGLAAAQRLAVALQVVFVVGILQMPLLLPYLGTAGSITALAPIAGAVTAAGAVMLYSGSYTRMIRLAIEGAPVRGSRLPVLRALIPLAARLSTRSSAAQAVCTFTLRTLVRSRQHRMLMAGWVGVAAALVVASIVPLALARGWSAFAGPHPSVLAAPLVLAVLTLTGMRMAFAIPVEIRANWSLRLAQPLKASEAVDGAAAALLVALVPPIALAGLSATLLWGVWAGTLHAGFCAALGVLLAQILTLGLEKIPFTCTYVPGKAQVIKFWPLYLAAFSLLTYTMAAIETQLLRRGGMIHAVVLFTLFAAVMSWIRSRQASRILDLRFEEQPTEALTLVSF